MYSKTSVYWIFLSINVFFFRIQIYSFETSNISNIFIKFHAFSQTFSVIAGVLIVYVCYQQLCLFFVECLAIKKWKVQVIYTVSANKSIYCLWAYTLTFSDSHNWPVSVVNFNCNIIFSFWINQDWTLSLWFFCL